jgi:predicted N-acyltransferase
MNDMPRNVTSDVAAADATTAPAAAEGRVDIITRDELARCGRWSRAFAQERKDHRYYEIVEDTLLQGFDYRYFAIRDGSGEVRAVQPFFICHQDMLAGLDQKAAALVERVRFLWPGFMRMRTLMVGCAAGEGHLDEAPDFPAERQARLLAAGITAHARRLRAPLIVFKEFPARYREAMQCLLDHGFARVPSLPMTKLCIDYQSFDDYMKKALNSATRTKLRRKFRATDNAAPIELSIVDDITPVVADVYPLYLQVYQRSQHHFEKLTEDYFCRLGRLMPDKVRFFVWRQSGKIVAFTLCMIEGDAIYAEYIGLDYPMALELHLYHYAVRDMITWAIGHGYKWFRSSGLNYDPKLHLRHLLDPVDLYVRHVSRVANVPLRWALTLLEPTRYDKTLQKFANYADLWAKS